MTQIIFVALTGSGSGRKDVALFWSSFAAQSVRAFEHLRQTVLKRDENVTHQQRLLKET